MFDHFRLFTTSDGHGIDHGQDEVHVGLRIANRSFFPPTMEYDTKCSEPEFTCYYLEITKQALYYHFY